MNQNFLDKIQRSEEIEREFEKRAHRAQRLLTLVKWFVYLGVALFAGVNVLMLVYVLWQVLR